MATADTMAEFWIKAASESVYVQDLFDAAISDVRDIEDGALAQNLATDLRSALDEILIPLAYTQACKGNLSALPVQMLRTTNMRHDVLGRMQAVLTPMALVQSAALQELHALVEVWKTAS